MCECFGARSWKTKSDILNKFSLHNLEKLTLSEFISCFWKERSIVSKLFIMWILICCSILLFVDDVYKSKINVQLVNSLSEDEFSRNVFLFEKYFFDEKVFNEWNKHIGQTIFEYSDINRKEKLKLERASVEFQVLRELEFLKVVPRFSDRAFTIVIRTNKLSKIRYVYGYADHVANRLKLDMKKNLIFRENNQFAHEDDNAKGESRSKLSKGSEKNQKVFELSNATKPQLLYPEPLTTIILCSFLGLFSGMVSVLFIKARCN